MNEEFLFYWLMWVFFIIVYFFMETGRKRTLFLFWILITIITTNMFLNINGVSVSIAFLCFLLSVIIFYVTDVFSIYKMIATFPIMIGYVSLLMWKKITPIWFFMPSYFMIPILSVVVISFLLQKHYEQITAALVGISFGQLIYEMIVISYRLNNIIGEQVFFIHISITILLLIIIQFFQTCLFMILNKFRRNIV
ncbi:YphA family membrane protein [Pseudogracilibacillus sp. SO30301A]|uniref:YphA family membrane protein n=1 Tax=Pseudogracilibacillus sp. SO30301A TaxID=3098291 RepID=UPI00300DEB9A